MYSILEFYFYYNKLLQIIIFYAMLIFWQQINSTYRIKKVIK